MRKTREKAIRRALRLYGEKLLREEQARGILPDEQRLLAKLP